MATIIVGGLIEKSGKYLLVQEAKEKYYGKWNIPAGHLDANETICDGAIREVLEETGCKVELTGVLQIANRLLNNDMLFSVIFSTKLLEENISYDKEEILDVKWFSYEEILGMKDELRDFDWLIDNIEKMENNKIASIDLIKIIS